MRWTVKLMLVLACGAGALISAPDGRASDPLEVRMKIAENQYFPKGGIGIINRNVYVNLRSGRNELILDGKPWVGSESGQRQVILVSAEGVVISKASLPPDFKLETSVVISFEGEKVYFLDFKSGVGGFYSR